MGIVLVLCDNNLTSAFLCFVMRSWLEFITLLEVWISQTKLNTTNINFFSFSVGTGLHLETLTSLELLGISDVEHWSSPLHVWVQVRICTLPPCLDQGWICPLPLCLDQGWDMPFTARFGPRLRYALYSLVWT